MSMETWVSLGGLLAVALTILGTITVGNRGLRAEISVLRAEVSLVRTDLTKLITTNHEKAMAATERLRVEMRDDFTQVRSEHVEIRRSITMLADRLFDETRRDRAASG